MKSGILKCLISTMSFCASFAWLEGAAGQSFNYEPKPRASSSGLTYASPDPAPTMMRASEAVPLMASRPERGPVPPSRNYAPQGGWVAPSYGGPSMAQRLRYELAGAARGNRTMARAPQPMRESIPAGQPLDPFGDGPQPSTSASGSYYPPSSSSVPQGEYVEGQMIEGPMADGEMMDGAMMDGEMMDGGCGAFGCNGCDECDNCAGIGFCGFLKGCNDCLKQTYLFSPCAWKNFSFYTGKQGFKNPTDLGLNGDFGYHGGVNWGSPLWNRYGIGYQLGGALLMSDFEGHSGPLRNRRTQSFITSGIFRRAPCSHGFQGGLVADYLADNFYVHANLWQIRGEVSYVFNPHELGFWFAAHLNSKTQTSNLLIEQNSVTWQAMNQYNIFYRYTFANGSYARSWAGLSGHGDGIFGSDAVVPFSNRWGMQASYNYLLPRQDDNMPNNTRESWSLMISLVWFPGHRCDNDSFNRYRPLIPVADNGWLLETTR
jgi:hypothetical protein